MLVSIVDPYSQCIILPKSDCVLKEIVDSFQSKGMLRWQKLDLFLQNKGVLKLMLSTNNISCSPNPIFIQENHF